MPSNPSTGHSVSQNRRGASERAKTQKGTTKSREQESSQDRTGDITAAYQAASDFKSNNQDAISKTKQRLASSAEVKAIEEKIQDFATSSQVLMDILDDVRKIHPVIDVVVLAFKAVVALELKRRDNDQKVLVLQVKMQDMMEIFVQLRVISPDQKEPNRGFTVAESLKKLCTRISDDIWSCANLCDTYSKKRLLVKLLKSPIYEGRFAGYIDTFVDRRTELHTALSMFTAHKIHSAFSVLEKNQEVLESIHESIRFIFEKLRTQSPLEQELWKVIEEKGGLEKCAQDDSALSELIKVDSYGSDPPPEEAAIPNQQYPGVNPSPHYSVRARSMASNQAEYSQIRPSPSYTINPSPSRSRRRSESHIPPPPPIPTQPNYYAIPTSRVSRPASPQPNYYPSTSIPTPLPPPGSYAYSRPGYRYGSQGYPDYTPREQSSRSYSAVSAKHYASRTQDAESADGSPTTERLSRSDPPQHVINDLKEELQVDIDSDLKKNMVVFRRKLDEQRRQLQQIEDTVVRQGNRIVDEVHKGPHNRIHDPELREIWKEMGWKLGVPVQEFVHTLHDYYVAQANDPSILDDYFTHLSPGSTPEDQTIALRRAFSVAKQRAAEKWALKHINIRNIIPLGEVFDGDASGFVSVWEANQVASLRPKDWSFLQWLAYWAAGRHFTIWQYRRKIGAIILGMHKSLEDLLPTNRAVVDHYLTMSSIVDQILCQVQPYTEEPNGLLAEKIAAYARTEEDMMEQKLRALNYEIDGPDTLRLIIGESQIERNLLPLIYLLLKHHLMVIRTGLHSVFDREEFLTAEQTLQQIFDAIYIRIQVLHWLFSNDLSSPYLVEQRLQSFAYGTYSALFQGQNPYYPVALDYDIPKELEANMSDFDSVIQLKYPPPRIVDTPEETIRPFRLKDHITGVEGFWNGHLFDENHVSAHGLIDFRVHTWNFSDGVFKGNGSYSQGTIFISGTIEIHRQQGTLDALLIAKPDYQKDLEFRIFLRGTLSIVRHFSGKSTTARSLPPQYTISGEWGYSSDKSKVHGAFYLGQTPAWAYHFRSRIVESGHPARARSLWSFACNAVLHQVCTQKGLFRTETVREMLAQLKKGAELSRCLYLLPDTQLMSTRDREEVNKLLLTVTPWNWRFYRSVARTRFDWGTIHYGCFCSICHGVILGSRYYCYTCSSNSDGSSIEFCSNCRHEHDKEEIFKHSYLKMRCFNHPRDTLHLSNRIWALCARPSLYPSMSVPQPGDPPFTPALEPPVIPLAASPPMRGPLNPNSESSSVSDRSDFPGPKRVRFSLNALRSPSSRSGHRSQHRRHASSPTVAWLGLPRSRTVSAASQNANSATDETAVGESEKMDPESRFSVEDTILIQPRCVSCNRTVDLMIETYWSCVVCSDPTRQKYVVACADCELRDRPIPPAKASPVTGDEVQQENESHTHSVNHPILRVYGPYIPFDGQSAPPWYFGPIGGSQGEDSSTSKRRMALEFIKGIFNGKKTTFSPFDNA
ncbi:hypothetical protein GYMLUDRAFT_262272 [Collybiopsis luxurians FD-317 M1]|uniref:Uncharacterized protein n=1 Tax=Collybiopsis luxurians FD-317 M1 TaxID=944289 RepID=A0A0D0CTB5_9AGAR|nr:hypothetical protein GYMLUDRAFT_262272 [Collybiopsis luxurians FD-317 M1]